MQIDVALLYFTDLYCIHKVKWKWCEYR